MERALSPWSTMFRGIDCAIIPMLGGHMHLATAPCPVEEERGLGGGVHRLAGDFPQNRIHTQIALTAGVPN